jgi:hypothetical protein
MIGSMQLYSRLLHKILRLLVNVSRNTSFDRFMIATRGLLHQSNLLVCCDLMQQDLVCCCAQQTQK